MMEGTDNRLFFNMMTDLLDAVCANITDFGGEIIGMQEILYLYYYSTYVC